jgi:hypothetical protein
MLAMALLLHGGLLGGMGDEAAGVDGIGEGAWTLATPAEGFLAASRTGELAHLPHLCLFRAFPRGASLRSGERVDNTLPEVEGAIQPTVLQSGPNSPPGEGPAMARIRRPTS